MKSVPVITGSASYEVVIGPAERKRLSAAIGELGAVRQVLLVVDEIVARLHAARLSDDALPGMPIAARFLVPAGEASKSLATLGSLYDALAAAQIARQDLLVCIGGGVVGDLGGLAAATWLRGVRHLQVPTTLEAAIDASVGGKTAINHSSGKNLIGAFHQPAGVIVDTDFLATLPQRDFVAGLAESVKHAAIRDEDFFAWHERSADAILARQPDVLVELIARNVTIKAAVVGQDEREAHLRMILNYGHTIGHALESLLDYELRHGECIALGMIAENAIAVRRGWLDIATAQRVRALLARLTLPVHLPRKIDEREIVRRCQMDKKVRDGGVRLAIIRGLGRAEIVADVSPADLAAGTAELQ